MNCVSSYEECEKPGRLCFRGLLVEVCLALVGVASPAQFKYTTSHRRRQSLGPVFCYENYTATLPERLVVRYQTVTDRPS